MTSIDSVLEQALALPVGERELLIDLLAGSLPEELLTISPEWEAEIERRIVSIHDGSAKMVSMEEAIESFRKAANGTLSSSSPCTNSS